MAGESPQITQECSEAANNSISVRATEEGGSLGCGSLAFCGLAGHVLLLQSAARGAGALLGRAQAWAACRSGGCGWQGEGGLPAGSGDNSQQSLGQKTLHGARCPPPQSLGRRGVPAPGGLPQPPFSKQPTVRQGAYRVRGNC